MSLLLPGDTVFPDIRNAHSNIYISRGFTQVGNSISATQAGFASLKSSSSTFTMSTSSNVYYPNVGDQVVGIIQRAIPKEGYIVDINSYRTATLPITAFEGATRSNQTLLQVNSCISILRFIMHTYLFLYHFFLLFHRKELQFMLES